MEAVTNHQSGSTRIRPLVVAVAALVVMGGLIGVSAYTGVLPNKRASAQDEGSVVRSEPKPGQAAACALCGTIESIRSVEVLDETGSAVGAADSRSGTDAASSGSSTETSVLDTLSGVVFGSADARSARKRLVYRVTLRMDDGSFRAISLPSPPAFAVGDKVRVVEGRLVRS